MAPMGVPDTPQAAQSTREQREAIAKATHFRFDNVADYYAEHAKHEWSLGSDVPNWAPPFKRLWAEWRIPPALKIGRTIIDSPCEGQVGILANTEEVQDETRPQFERWLRVKQWKPHATSCHSVEETVANTRWFTLCVLWISVPIRPICGAPVLIPQFVYLMIDGAGRLINTAVELLPGDRDGIWGEITVFGLGLSFMHCKNVAIHSALDDRGDRWHAREKAPILKYHTLDIAPMQRTLRIEGGADVQGLPRAMHICRGHFATYSPDHPLFGKYVGTFWRPDHVRGKAENGVVVKDYSITGVQP